MTARLLDDIRSGPPAMTPEDAFRMGQIVEMGETAKFALYQLHTRLMLKGPE